MENGLLEPRKLKYLSTWTKDRRKCRLKVCRYGYKVKKSMIGHSKAASNRILELYVQIWGILRGYAHSPKIKKENPANNFEEIPELSIDKNIGIS